MANPEIITPPATEPMTSQELYDECHLNVNAEPALITESIVAARMFIEEQTGLRIITQHLRQHFEPWHVEFHRLDRSLRHHRRYNYLEFYAHPVSAVTAVKWYDTNEALQTLVVDTDYIVDLISLPCAVRLKTHLKYSVNKPYPFFIEYVAGQDTPHPLDKKLVRMAAHHFFMNGRSAVSEKALFKMDAFQNLLAIRCTNVFGRNQRHFL